MSIAPRGSVIKVVALDDPQKVGTAFFIGPSTALTCKHVALFTNKDRLRLMWWDNQKVSIREIKCHPDDEIDAAILEVDAGNRLDEWIKISEQQVLVGDSITICGYSGAETGIEERPYQVISYDASRRLLCLQNLAAHGLSGSPALVDGAVVGIAKALWPNRQLTHIIPVDHLRELIRATLGANSGLATPSSDWGEPGIYSDETRRPGLSSVVGSLHVHIDGGGDKAVAEETVLRIDPTLENSEIATVLETLPGPDRQHYQEVYKLHTPENNGQETVDYFSTTQLHLAPEQLTDTMIEQIQGKVDRILGVLHSQQTPLSDGQIVVEAERVVGMVESSGTSRWVENRSLPRAFRSNGVFRRGRQPGPGNLYEVHFSLDVPVGSGGHAPIRLDTLGRLCAQAGISIGGWFRFAKADAWAYRSNMFRRQVGPEEAQRWHSELLGRLRLLPGLDVEKVKLRVLVEEALGVWRTPFEKYDERIITIPELAAWEANQPAGSSFWVVTGNFLGDQDIMIEDAMVENLRKGVRYSYFLQSFADLHRWHGFRSRLETGRGLRNDVLDDLMSAYVLEFEGPEIWNRRLGCFVENAEDLSTGYRLSRDRRTGHEMTKKEIEEVHELISYPVGRKMLLSSIRLPSPFPDRDGGTLGALIWLDFGFLGTSSAEESSDSITAFVKKFDTVIGVKVSEVETGAAVVRCSEIGYAVLLPRIKSDNRSADVIRRALILARSMTQELDEIGTETGLAQVNFTMVIGYGRLQRTITSRGFSFGGDLVSSSRRTAASLPPRSIAALREVVEAVEAQGLTEISFPTLQNGDSRDSWRIVTWV